MPVDFDRCVADVTKQQIKKGKSAKAARSSAFGICTAQFKKAGKRYEKLKQENRFRDRVELWTDEEDIQIIR